MTDAVQDYEWTRFYHGWPTNVGSWIERAADESNHPVLAQTMRYRVLKALAGRKGWWRYTETHTEQEDGTWDVCVTMRKVRHRRSVHRAWRKMGVYP